MDIGNGRGPALSPLSTTALHTFAIDGVKCLSLESLIQSLKFEKASLQASVCSDKPKVAKERGKKVIDWAAGHKVHWKGVPMDRTSEQHKGFVEHVVREMARQCPEFCQALSSTGDLVLTSPGKSRESETPVTEAEYCRALKRVRGQLLSRERAALLATEALAPEAAKAEVESA